MLLELCYEDVHSLLPLFQPIKGFQDLKLGRANASWDGPNLKFSDFCWATRFISVYVVAKHKNEAVLADIR